MERYNSNIRPQTATTLRRPSLPLLKPVLGILLLLPVLALFIIFLIFPSFINYHISNIKVTVSDYLNIILLLFAIFCGVIGKRKDSALLTKSQPLISSHYYEYTDPRAESISTETRSSGMRRNSSYPDFRQTSEWETCYNEYRFHDDFELDRYRPSSTMYNRPRVRRNEVADRDETDIKVIPVDTFEVFQSPRPLRSEDIGHDRIHLEEKEISTSEMKKSGGDIPKRKCKRRHKTRKIRNETEKVPSPQQSFPPPPPPPPPLPFHNLFKKGDKTKKLHSISPDSPPISPRSIFNDILKPRSKSKRFQNQLTSTSSCPPPPPPPPPLSSIYNNILKIGSKSKRFLNLSASSQPLTHSSLIFNDIFKTGSKSKRFKNQTSIAPPPPPPLPPPPSSIFSNIFKSGNKSKRFEKKTSSVPPPAPPLPPSPSSIINNIFKTESGSKSKRFYKQFLSAPPPAPPLPPSSLLNTIFKFKNESDQAFPPPPPPPTSISDTMLESSSKRFDPAPTSLPPWRSPSRPPLPAKKTNFYSDEILDSEVQSPLIQVTPPLLVPSFRVAEKSLENFDISSLKETYDKTDDGDGLKSFVMCPSPDVNLKADSFIARLKGEWRLEKLNSVREKSNLSIDLISCPEEE